MTFLESMRKRYTTKEYDPSKSIPKEQLEELKEILQLSPSSINSQPWKFYFVTSEDKKAEFAEQSGFNKDRVLNCSCLVVFVRPDNLEAYEQELVDFLGEGGAGYYRNVKKPQGEQFVKEWLGKQLYLSLGVLLSACAEMKIDSTPMEGIDFEGYDKVLGINDYTTQVAVAMGYRAESDQNQPSIKPKRRKDLDSVVIDL